MNAPVGRLRLPGAFECTSASTVPTTCENTVSH